MPDLTGYTLVDAHRSENQVLLDNSQEHYKNNKQIRKEQLVEKQYTIRLRPGKARSNGKWQCTILRNHAIKHVFEQQTIECIHERAIEWIEKDIRRRINNAEE